MPFGVSSTVIAAHKHSSATGDGGVLDADQSEVDLDTLEDYVQGLAVVL